VAQSFIFLHGNAVSGMKQIWQ